MREHGTNACYRFGPEPGNDWRKGCRCRPCITAAVTYTKQWERRRAKGWRPYVDNTEAREHLHWLTSHGIGERAVAQASGVSRSVIRNMITGDLLKSRPETIERILAVGTHVRLPGALVDATRTWELLNELIAQGHTQTSLARLLGSTAKRPVLQIKRDRIEQKTADKVQALYDRLMAPVIAHRMRSAERRAHYRALERERREAS